MEFTGISRTFSTVGEKQYETIGAFWEEMSARYGRENLRGLGFNWTATQTSCVHLVQGVIITAFLNRFFLILFIFYAVFKFSVSKRYHCFMSFRPICLFCVLL